MLRLVSIGSFQARQAQKLTDNAPHALGFPAEHGYILARRQSLQPSPDHGGRGPQLMRGIGRKAALHLHRLDQALEALVDGSYERLHLAGCLLDRQWGMS